MEFDAPERKLARPPEIRRATGLFNLNIYASDMEKESHRQFYQNISEMLNEVTSEYLLFFTLVYVDVYCRRLHAC